MSLENQYDAWVRGLMGGGKYAATPKQAEDASEAVQQMQAQLDALAAAQKRQSAAGGAGQRAAGRNRHRRECAQDEQRTDEIPTAGRPFWAARWPRPPAPAAPAKADFCRCGGYHQGTGAGAGRLCLGAGQGVPPPLCAGHGAGCRARPQRDAALRAQRHRPPLRAELCGRGAGNPEHSAQRGGRNAGLSLYPGPAQEKLFLQDLYAALQSDAEVLAFEHYEDCAANYLNMLATLAMDGTLALSSRYVLQRGILVDVGTALAPGAIGELQAGGKYFVFYSNKDEAALADHFGAKFVDAVAGDICRTEAFTPEALAAVAARELNYLAQRTRKQCGLALDGRGRARFAGRPVWQNQRYAGYARLL